MSVEFNRNLFRLEHGEHAGREFRVDPDHGPYYTIGQGIQAALDQGSVSAATRGVVVISPGVYDEAVTMQPFIDLRASGPAEDTIIQRADATLITLASNCVIEGFTLNLNAPTAARNMIVEGGAPTARTGVVLRNCILTITTPGAFDHRVLLLQAASSILVERCRTPNAGSIGGTGATAIIRNDTAAATIAIRDCDFNIANTSAMHLFSNVAGTWTSNNNSFRGTAGMFGIGGTPWTNGTYSGSGNRNITTGTSSVTLANARITEKSGPLTYEVYAGMRITHARIAAAADTPAPAAANRYTIRIHTGTYDSEALAGADFIDLFGVDRDGVIVQETDATVLTLGAITCRVENLTLTLVTPTLARNMLTVTGVGTITLRNIRHTITTPGGLAHQLIRISAAATVTIEGWETTVTDGANPGIRGIVNTTGAATITLRHNDVAINDTAGMVLFSDIGGTWTSTGNSFRGTAGIFGIAGTAWSLGTFIGSGDRLLATAASSVTGGRVTEKSGPLQYEVYRGMLIAHALTAAAADTPAPSATSGYDIAVHQGVYTEALTLAAFVTVRGVARPEDVIIRQADATVITLVTNSRLERVTVDLNAPSVARNIIIDNAVAATSVFIFDCLFTITTPGAFDHRIVYLTAASQVVIRHCRTVEAGIGGTGAYAIVANETAGATITMEENNFSINNTNGMHLLSTIAGTWRAMGNSFRGTAWVTNSWTLATYLGTGNQYRTVRNGAQFNITSGSFTEKAGPAVYDVFRGMLIQDALTAANGDTPAPAAANRYVVRVHPGTYSVALSYGANGNVTIEGVGDRAEVIITVADNGFLLDGGVNCAVKNLTLQMTAAAGGRTLIRLPALVTGFYVENVVFDITGAAAGNAIYAVNSAAAAAHTITLVRCTGTIGGTGASAFVRETTGTLTATLVDCSLTMNSVSGFILEGAATVLTVNSFGGVYTGTGGLVTTGAAAHRITLNGGWADMDAASVHGAGARTVWKTARQTYEVCAGMLIQHALDAVDADTPTPAAANRYVIRVHPSTYTESLAIGANGNVTLAGVGDRAEIIITQADAAVIALGGADNVAAKNLTLQVTAGAAGRALVTLGTAASTGVYLENIVFDMTGAVAGNALYVVNSTFAGAHTITLERCVGTIGGTGASVFVRETTGTLTATLRACELTMNSASGFIFEGAVTVLTVNAFSSLFTGTGGLYTTGAAAHRITLNGGVVDMDAASVTGAGTRTVWKTGRQQYDVAAGMVIQHAIDAAAADTPAPAATAPYTVLLHPGEYTEALTGATFVNVVGLGRDSVVVRQVDANVITIGAITATIDSITVRLVTPTAARDLILVSGAGTVTLKNIRLEVTTPGGFANRLLPVTAAATVDVQDCFITDYTGGAAAAALGIELTAGATVRAKRCDFTFTNTGAFVYSSSGASGTLSLDHCRAAGTATHLRTGNATALIRVRESQYRSILRTSGNIVDESPSLPKGSFMRLVDWALTSAVAANNLATRLAVGGAVDVGGPGQLRARINDNAADEAGVEQGADAAGSLDSSFTAARTPRFVTRFSLNAFRATSDMFLGLRQTLGGALPTTENHFGFDWNGTNFRATSGDGVAQQTTNLTTPSTGAEHILEAICLAGVQVEFYVDGVLVATHATRVPTGAIDIQLWHESDGLGGATTSDLTLRQTSVVECPA